MIVSLEEDEVAYYAMMNSTMGQHMPGCCVG